MGSYKCVWNLHIVIVTIISRLSQHSEEDGSAVLVCNLHVIKLHSDYLRHCIDFWISSWSWTLNVGYDPSFLRLGHILQLSFSIMWAGCTCSSVRLSRTIWHSACSQLFTGCYDKCFDTYIIINLLSEL